jgi:hypothetical protein
MSDTPETDAIADFYLAKAFSKDPADRTVPCQFAARLERDLNRAIRERDEAREILRKLLEIIPEPECHDFGHTKEERHAFLEKCPVMARYDALIAQAKEAAK